MCFLTAQVLLMHDFKVSFSVTSPLIVLCFRGRMSTGGGDLNSHTLLPNKLKTEIALHVNLETLRKVKLWKYLFSTMSVSSQNRSEVSILSSCKDPGGKIIEV